MLTLVQVQQIFTGAGRPDLVPHAPLVVQLAQIYINNDANGEDMIRDYVVPEVAGALPAGAVVPDQVRNAFIDQCESWALIDNQDASRAQVLALQLQGPPAPPAPPPAPNAYVAHAQRLRQLRTDLATQRGAQLAATARLMDGWFTWVPSGPVNQGILALVPNAGPMYQPKQLWDHHGAIRRNDFAAWMNRNAPVPSPRAHMNCWEAVLYSAFRANLVTLEWLRVTHRRAAMVNEFNHVHGGNGEEHYGRALSYALGFYNSVPFAPRGGLIPYVGDVIYWDQNEHVAISLGRRWVNGAAEDRIMSHWHNNGGTFSELTLEDLPVWARTGFRFRPCPF